MLRTAAAEKRRPMHRHPAATDELSRWAARGLSAGLLGLGLLFLARPRPAARLFGIPNQGGDSFVRALGLRDLALAAGLATASLGSRRALALTAGLAAMIPAGDMILVGSARRGRAKGSLVLHGLSLAALGAIACLAGPGAAPVITEPRVPRLRLTGAQLSPQGARTRSRLNDRPARSRRSVGFA